MLEQMVENLILYPLATHAILSGILYGTIDRNVNMNSINLNKKYIREIVNETFKNLYDSTTFKVLNVAYITPFYINYLSKNL